MGFDSVKYMGSKQAMLRNGLGTLIKFETKRSLRFVDPFCGSAAVAWFAAEETATKVVAADMQHYAAILAKAVLLRTKPLNPIRLAIRWFTRAQNLLESWPAYAEAERFRRRAAGDSVAAYVQDARQMCNDDKRLGSIWHAYGGYYYSPSQALTFDALRATLPQNPIENPVALAALIFAASSCAASPGHTAQPFQPTRGAAPHLLEAWQRDPAYYCYRALYDLCPRHANVVGEVHVANAASIVDQVEATDLVFLDPPYSAVQYSRFYHVLETVALGRCGPVDGAGRYPPRSERPQSEFSLTTKSDDALRSLLEKLSDKKATVILTFPAGTSSNGLTGSRVLQIASEFYKIEKQTIEGKFSTLGGNGSAHHRPAVGLQ